jgi:hypothetical protein
MDARPRLAALAKTGRGISLRYEWIKDYAAFNSLCLAGNWELSDGAEWITLWRLAETND